MLAHISETWRLTLVSNVVLILPGIFDCTWTQHRPLLIHQNVWTRFTLTSLLRLDEDPNPAYHILIDRHSTNNRSPRGCHLTCDWLVGLDNMNGNMYCSTSSQESSNFAVSNSGETSSTSLSPALFQTSPTQPSVVVPAHDDDLEEE